MKVLMVSKACYLASYRRKLEELADLGVDLTLVVPPFWRSGDRELTYEPGNDRGYRTVLQQPVLNGNFHLHFYPRLAGLVLEVQPDLVHVDEEPYDLVTLAACRAARSAGAPAIFFTWQNIYRQYPPPFSFFERTVYRRSRGAIAGSRDAALILRRKGYRHPVYVIPQFGVDPDLFAFHASEPGVTFTAERPFRIGFAGRLVPEKGLSLLLEAASGLSGDWQVTFIGDGPLRDTLKQQAAGHGIASRVAFTGNVPSEEVPAHLAKLDVLVNPSLTWVRGRSQWKEQFGRSLVEAMACGVPVIGSDSGEIPHVIGGAGLIAPEGDAMALRNHLETLMGSSQLRQDLASAGRDRVMQHYTQRRIAELTFAVYGQLLSP